MRCSVARVAALVAALVLWTIFGLRLRWNELAELRQMDPASSQLKVLMVRTIGRSEVEFTKNDIRSLAKKTRGIQTANTSHCAARKGPGLKAKLAQDRPPDQWPADVVCYAGITHLRVDLHVILLVWDNKVDFIDTSDLELNVSVISAPKTRKINAWLLHLSETAVSAYDYVWLADGDVNISMVNWFAFWTQMLYFRPQVAQPVVLGFDRGNIQDRWRHRKKGEVLSGHRASDHEILRIPPKDSVWNVDPTLIAAEVGIVEIMTPVLTPQAWMALREELLSNSKAMQWIVKGATWCVDVRWCDLARAALGSEVAREPDVCIGSAGQMFDKKQGRGPGERPWEPGELPACLVFYQTPVRHHDFRSLNKSRDSHSKNAELCNELEVRVTNTTSQCAYRAVYESDLEASLRFNGSSPKSQMHSSSCCCCCCNLKKASFVFFWI